MKHPLTTGLIGGALLLGGYHYRNEISRTVAKKAIRLRILGRDFQQLITAGKDVINDTQAMKHAWHQFCSFPSSLDSSK
ncbi:hypothetical protein ACI3E1_01200 [Ligilactobacillus sp. LYQ139]|uniref:hypothetical protein n=1 Tax=Ligilactobacillus sp. LYQ139 TaxID=3378800 RepID=UPI0038548B9F